MVNATYFVRVFNSAAIGWAESAISPQYPRKTSDVHRPSTETCLTVVSFTVALPFWLGSVLVRYDRTAAPI